MLLTSFEGLLASGGAKPPLQLAPDTLLFSFIIFGVLLAVLYKFALSLIHISEPTRPY